jgi:polysaccharide export outer membrane protein
MGIVARLLLSMGEFIFFPQQPSTEAQPALFAAPEPSLSVHGLPMEHDRSLTSTGYILGPGDQIIVRAVNVDEISDKPIAVDLNGYVRVPMAGRVKVAGLTLTQVEGELTKRLRTYVRQPDISLSVAEFQSQPVSVIGAVRNPGVQQVQGHKRLVEILSLAGGLDANAGSTLRITRRREWGRIPLATAADDLSGQFSVAQVKLKSILEAKNPEENILVKPYDVVSVPRAEMVYVIGQVQKSGGIVLNDREEISVLQALSIAGGLDRTAQPQNARILRRRPEGPSRKEIAVDLRRILNGKSSDLAMQPEDILFVPSSVPKKAALRAVEAVIQLGTGVIIWRR